MPNLADPLIVKAKAHQNLLQKLLAHPTIDLLHKKFDDHEAVAGQCSMKVIQKLLSHQNIVSDIMAANKSSLPHADKIVDNQLHSTYQDLCTYLIQGGA